MNPDPSQNKSGPVPQSQVEETAKQIFSAQTFQVRGLFSRTPESEFIESVARWLSETGKAPADFKITISESLLLLTEPDGTVAYRKNLADLSREILISKEFGIGGHALSIEKLIIKATTMLESKGPVPALVAAAKVAWWFEDVFPRTKEFKESLETYRRSQFPPTFTPNPLVPGSNGRGYLLFKLLSQTCRDAYKNDQLPEIGLELLAHTLFELRENYVPQDGLYISGKPYRGPAEIVKEIRNLVQAKIPASEFTNESSEKEDDHESEFLLLESEEDETSNPTASPEEVDEPLEAFINTGISSVALLLCMSSLLDSELTDEEYHKTCEHTDIVRKYFHTHPQIKEVVDLVIAINKEEGYLRLEEDTDFLLEHVLKSVPSKRGIMLVDPIDRYFACIHAGKIIAKEIQRAKAGIPTDFLNDDIDDIEKCEKMLVAGRHLLEDVEHCVQSISKMTVGNQVISQGVPSSEARDAFAALLTHLSTFSEDAEGKYLTLALKDLDVLSATELAIILEPSTGKRLSLNEIVLLGQSNGTFLHLPSYGTFGASEMLHLVSPQGIVGTSPHPEVVDSLMSGGPVGRLSQFIVCPGLGLPEYYPIPTLADVACGITHDDLKILLGKHQFYEWERINLLSQASSSSLVVRYLLDGLSLHGAVLLASTMVGITRKEALPEYPATESRYSPLSERIATLKCALLEFVNKKEICSAALEEMQRSKPLLSKLSEDPADMLRMMEHHATILKLRAHNLTA